MIRVDTMMRFTMEAEETETAEIVVPAAVKLSMSASITPPQTTNKLEAIAAPGNLILARCLTLSI
jgi:hypothetical protein